MTLAHLIPDAIRVSIVLTVFALGLKATVADATYLIRRPGLLIRTLLSLNVLMLVVATVIILVLDLPPPVKVAIEALAVSAVPPALPKRSEQVIESSSYGVGLLATAALFAIVLAPLSIAVLARYSGIDWHVPPLTVAKVVLMVVLAPLVIGIALRYFTPDFAERVAHPISLFATILLAVAVLPVLFVASHAVWNLIGNGVLVSLILFALIGLAVGHLLGGPDPDNRTVLALATSTRHPGVAMTIAGLIFTDQKAVLAVVLLHMVVGAVVSIPYMKWRKKVHAKTPFRSGIRSGLE